MATILLIVIGVVVLIASIATLVEVARDGYRQVPTRPDRHRLS
ncbi:hypothetical protein AAIB33_12240 [Microbacterium sp. AZCO]